MTIDTRIVNFALTAFVFGWPVATLVYLFVGRSSLLDWFVLGLIGLTIGLAGRWLTRLQWPDGN